MPLLFQDLFNRADVQSGAVANATGIGQPTNVYAPAVPGAANAAKDRRAGVSANNWEISGNRLKPTLNGLAAASGGYPSANMLFWDFTPGLPQVNQTLIIKFRTDANVAKTVAGGDAANYQLQFSGFLHTNIASATTGTGAAFTLFNASVALGYINGTATTTAPAGGQVTSASFPANLAGCTGAGGKLLPSTDYTATYKITKTGASSSSVTITISQTQLGTVLGTVTGDLATIVIAGMNTATHNPGGFGIGYVPWTTAPNLYSIPSIEEISLYYDPDANLICSSANIVNTSTLNGLIMTTKVPGANWKTTPPAFAVSGVAGVQITPTTGVTVLSDTQAYFYVDATGGAGGTLTITQTAGVGTADTATLVVGAPTGATPVVPMPVLRTASAFDLVEFDIAPAYNGVGPYLYKVVRGITSTFNLGDADTLDITGAALSAMRVSYRPPTSQPYTYKVFATDNSGGAGRTGKSPAHFAVPGYVPPSNPGLVATPSVIPRWIAFGDSLFRVSPPTISSVYTKMAALVAAALPGAVQKLNTASSGKETRNFSPLYFASAPPYLNYYSVAALPSTETSMTMKAGLQSAIPFDVGIGCFGYNDASNHRTKQQYKDAVLDLQTNLNNDFPGKIWLWCPDYWAAGDGLRNDELMSYWIGLWELKRDNPALFVLANYYLVMYLCANNTGFYDGIHFDDPKGTIAAQYFSQMIATACTATGTIESIAIAEGATATVLGERTLQLNEIFTGTGDYSTLHSWTKDSGAGSVAANGLYTAPGAGTIPKVSVIRVTAINGMSATISITTPPAGAGGGSRRKPTRGRG